MSGGKKYRLGKRGKIRTQGTSQFWGHRISETTNAKESSKNKAQTFNSGQVKMGTSLANCCKTLPWLVFDLRKIPTFGGNVDVLFKPSFH